MAELEVDLQKEREEREVLHSNFEVLNTFCMKSMQQWMKEAGEKLGIPAPIFQELIAEPGRVHAENDDDRESKPEKMKITQIFFNSGPK